MRWLPLSARLGLVGCASIGLIAGISQKPQRPPPKLDRDHVFSRWLEAVRLHTPGQVDDSLNLVGDLVPADWQLLNPAIAQFVRDPHNQPIVRRMNGDPRYQSLWYWVTYAGPNDVIKRAAVLHMDAAMFEPIAPAQTSGSDWTYGPPPPLVYSMDAESIGAQDPNWNWILARELLDRLQQPDASRDPFVPIWYHATAAFMLDHRFYGEAASHLDHAASLAPNDARILFDRACLAEALALPPIQLVFDQLRAKSGARDRPARVFSPGLVPPVTSTASYPTESQANAEAERLFRQALASDPTFAEARVRLARLLEVRGKPTEAAHELSLALSTPVAQTDRVLGYFAHLFAARAEQARGQPALAAMHARDALLLFPDAQSALVEASEVALVRADVAGAIATVHRPARLLTEADDRTDPWWRYDTGPGRHVDELLAAIWAQTPGSGK